MKQQKIDFDKLKFQKESKLYLPYEHNYVFVQSIENNSERIHHSMNGWWKQKSYCLLLYLVTSYSIFNEISYFSMQKKKKALFFKNKKN